MFLFLAFSIFILSSNSADSIRYNSVCQLTSKFSTLFDVSAVTYEDCINTLIGNSGEIYNGTTRTNFTCDTISGTKISTALDDQYFFGLEKYINLMDKIVSISKSPKELKPLIEITSDLIISELGITYIEEYLSSLKDKNADTIHLMLSSFVGKSINQALTDYEMFLKVIPGFVCSASSNLDSLNESLLTQNNLSYIVVPKESQETITEICYTQSLKFHTEYCEVLKTLGIEFNQIDSDQITGCENSETFNMIVKNTQQWCNPIVWKVPFSTIDGYGSLTNIKVIQLLEKVIAFKEKNSTVLQKNRYGSETKTNEDVIDDLMNNTELDISQFIKVNSEFLLNYYPYGKYSKTAANNISEGIIAINDESTDITPFDVIFASSDNIFANEKLNSLEEIDKSEILTALINLETNTYLGKSNYSSYIYALNNENNDIHFSDTTLGGEENPNYPYEQPDILPQDNPEKPTMIVLEDSDIQIPPVDNPINDPSLTVKQKVALGLGCTAGGLIVIGLIISFSFIIYKCRKNHSSKLKTLVSVKDAESESEESKKYIRRSLNVDSNLFASNSTDGIEIHPYVTYRDKNHQCSSSSPEGATIISHTEENKNDDELAIAAIKTSPSVNSDIVENNEESSSKYLYVKYKKNIKKEKSPKKNGSNFINQVSDYLRDYKDLTIPETSADEKIKNINEESISDDQMRKASDIKQRMDFID